MDRLIYLDNAATTPVKPEVYEAMRPYLEEYYGNPSSIYRFAGESRKAVEQARETIADFLNAKPSEVYFTSGGTESDNWAIKSVALARKDRGRHIITSKIEHHAVLHSCEFLEKLGFEVTYLDVDEYGFVDVGELERAVREDTILISIMFANNEIGTIQKVSEIGRVARKHGVLFHTDAVQAYGHEYIDVNEMGIDLLSASAHKINGPKGVGILYVRQGIKLGPLMHGGAQERGRRAGTHNVAGIVGFGRATLIAKETLEDRRMRESELRDYLIDKVLAEIPHTRLNGHRTHRLSNNANFSFHFIEGESLLILLDQKNIAGSSGSACASGSLDPSHVLLAIGVEPGLAHGSLRLTLSPETTIKELDYVVLELKKAVERLRDMSPVYEDFLKNIEQGEVILQ